MDTYLKYLININRAFKELIIINKIIAVLFILVFVSGCYSKGTLKHEQGSVVIGRSNSCKTPPKTLKWDGRNYALKDVKTSLEPGMRFGFAMCNNGSYTVGDGGPNQMGVYSNGDPRRNNDLLFFGVWGRALYTMISK